MMDAPFAKHLDDVRASEARISDGVVAVGYSELASTLPSILQFLIACGVQATSCIAVETPNCVAGALLTLALLKNGISFVLFPPLPDADLKPVPRFCDFRVRVSAESPGAEPTGALQLDRNVHHDRALPQTGKLFLRTSGSMGASKIAVHSHAGLMGNAMNVVRKYGFGPDSRASIPVPIAHMYGFGAVFLAAILSGAAVDLQDKTNLLKYLDRERKFQPDIVFATPAICQMLMAGYKSVRTNYKVFVTSGQRISEELFRSFDPLVNGKLVNQYGSTEMGAIAACNPSDPIDLRAAAIGQPLSGVELRVEPADSPEPQDLFCLHPYGFEGYVDEDGVWLKQHRKEDWYRTGDLALSREDGSIIVTGRSDAAVNRRGYLVQLSDVERRMETLDVLSTVAVVAGKEERQEGRIAAFCVLKPGAGIDGLQLRERCFDLMPAYAIPDEVHLLTSLPLLPTGKIDRQKLATLLS